MHVYKFLTNKRYANTAMETWFDRVTDNWSFTAEAVHEGARHWSYYDTRRSAYAAWNVLAFRAQARLVLIEHRLWWKADKLLRRLGLVGPDWVEELIYAARQVRDARGYVCEPGEVYDQALVDLVIAATDLGEDDRPDVLVLLGIKPSFTRVKHARPETWLG